jgi:hypothetical protein
MNKPAVITSDAVEDDKSNGSRSQLYMVCVVFILLLTFVNYESAIKFWEKECASRKQQ